ncbi:hypothetical protein [Neisseria sp. Ec49-e6-T10]
MYLKGKKAKKDYDQAIYWYTKAAEQGDTNAQVNIGFIYGHFKKDTE